MLDVLALAGGRAGRPAEGIEAPEAALPAEESVEEITVVGPHRARASLRLILARELLLSLDPFPVRPHLIVLLPLAAVAQDLVGLVDQLEALGRLGVLVHVRMELTGQAPIGGLDLFVGRRPRHSQGRVVVLVLRCGHGSTSALVIPSRPGFEPPAAGRQAVRTAACSRQWARNLSTRSGFCPKCRWT